MKVKVIEERRNNTTLGTMDLKEGKVYDAKIVKFPLFKTEKPTKWYSIVDESGESFVYPESLFEIVEE